MTATIYAICISAQRGELKKEIEEAARLAAVEADYLVEADKTELEGKITAEAERADAGKRMKHSTDRNNYNWYLGDRKIMGIYIGYIVLVVATFIGIAAVSRFLNLSLFLNPLHC